MAANVRLRAARGVVAAAVLLALVSRSSSDTADTPASSDITASYLGGRARAGRHLAIQLAQVVALSGGVVVAVASTWLVACARGDRCASSTADQGRSASIAGLRFARAALAGACCTWRRPGPRAGGSAGPGGPGCSSTRAAGRRLLGAWWLDPLDHDAVLSPLRPALAPAPRGRVADARGRSSSRTSVGRPARTSVPVSDGRTRSLGSPIRRGLAPARRWSARGHWRDRAAERDAVASLFDPTDDLARCRGRTASPRAALGTRVDGRDPSARPGSAAARVLPRDSGRARCPARSPTSQGLLDGPSSTRNGRWSTRSRSCRGRPEISPIGRRSRSSGHRSSTWRTGSTRSRCSTSTPTRRSTTSEPSPVPLVLLRPTARTSGRTVPERIAHGSVTMMPRTARLALARPRRARAADRPLSAHDDGRLRASGTASDRATFELFVRRCPKGRAYLVFAGLEQAIGDLLRLRFSRRAGRGDPRLAGLRAGRPGVLRRAADLRFEGDVWAVPEGTVVFAGEPLIRVEAPLAAGAVGRDVPARLDRLSDPRRLEGRADRRGGGGPAGLRFRA